MIIIEYIKREEVGVCLHAPTGAGSKCKKGMCVEAKKKKSGRKEKKGIKGKILKDLKRGP